MARASKFETFDQDIRLATAGIAPDRIAAQLAQFAVQERDRVIREGGASPIYDTFVNGLRGAPETSVTAPGPIVYVFSYWQPIIEFALAYLKRRSPVLSGRYAASHMVMVGGQIMRPEAPISAYEEVTIVSDEPYSRKIESGHMQMSKPRFVYDNAARELQHKFGSVISVYDTFILLPNGYVLKGKFRRGFRAGARTSLRRDTREGARMTYPALIMKLKAA